MGGRIAATSELSLVLKDVLLKHEQTFTKVAEIELKWGEEKELPEILALGDWVAIQFSGDFSKSVDLERVDSFLGPHFKVQKVLLLAPCLEKPLQTSSNVDIQKLWMDFLKNLRHFFSAKGLLEISTPTLVACPGTEPFLDVFEVNHQPLMNPGRGHVRHYLPTSPELHLKKAMSSGYHNIFEIRNCFRQGEFSDRHQPEFTMLEWYRSFCSLENILQDVLDLISFISHREVPRSGVDIVSMADVFQEILDFNLHPESSLEDLKGLAGKIGLHPSVQDYLIWDDVFYQIFVEKIEPILEQRSQKKPLFLTKYPPSQAALARLTSDGWGDRFELYWKGMEIANAFHELNDPKIQAERFQHDLELKVASGREKVELDLDFLRALQAGMPPSAGIALGVERLFLSLHPQLKIQDLRVFPYLNK